MVTVTHWHQVNEVKKFEVIYVRRQRGGLSVPSRQFDSKKEPKRNCLDRELNTGLVEDAEMATTKVTTTPPKLYINYIKLSIYIIWER